MNNGVGAVQAALMLLFGILIGLKTDPPFWVCGVLCAAGLTGGIFFYRKGKNYVLDQLPKRLSRICFSIMIFAAGMGRTSLTDNTRPPGAIENYSGERVSGLTGYIMAPPVVTNSRTTLRIQLDKEQINSDLPNEGRILLVFYHDPEMVFEYGDRLSISGKVILPPDTNSGFSYRTYLERDGITAMINNPAVEHLSGFSGNRLFAGIYHLRKVLVNRIFRLFPKPENALMAGILLGDESKITSDVERDFQKTGTAHIIAISGANFTVLTWLLLGILRRLIPHWWAPALMLPFIAFYTILVGGNSAVVRAGIMCGLSILGSVLGRRGNGLNNLSLSAAAMCLWKPIMIYDLGFQLSVTATLGILLFSAPLCGLFRKILSKIFPKMGEEALSAAVTTMNDLCLMSISAQILTTWVSAQAFGQISLISLPANFLIAPFQSLIMLGGFAALLLSFVFYPLGAAAAWLVWAAPALTIRIVRACAGIKWGAVYFELKPFQAWMIIALILAAWSGRKLILNSIRRRNFLPYAALLLLFLAVMIWTNVWSRLDKRIEIEFHQTTTASSIKVCSWQNRCFVLGEQLTNYGAQDLLQKQLLPIPHIVTTAFIDIPEAWMQREFLASGVSDGLSIFYLNGESIRKTTEIPDKLTEGTIFSIDGINIHVITSYLGKRCWLLEKDGMKLLIPNGVPPERIFTHRGPDRKDITLVLVGKRDDKSTWTAFHKDNENQPQLQDFSEEGDITLIIRNDQISYYEN